MNRLLLATTNAGKLAELRAILGDLPFELLSPQDLGIRFEVVEDATTYLENARKKARAAVTASGLPSLADDSGLEVPLLGERPGVESAYFAGKHHYGDSRALVAALLRELGDQRVRSPAARFRCTAVLQIPGGREFVGEGVLAGTIAAELV
ncbi:MAG TPA: non-canonical purine NTP pyrophosphatase, partial [Candidatus Dormibacteraeota bacterium]|nr:non-canonical purine NTP pyrophosphatase [Candidatus Dormibacteraeota bacterium]